MKIKSIYAFIAFIITSIVFFDCKDINEKSKEKVNEKVDYIQDS